MKILYCDSLMIIWIFSLASIVLTFGFLQYSLATLDNSVKSSNNVTNDSNYTLPNIHIKFILQII